MKPTTILLLTFAASATLAQASVTYTWTGSAGDGDWNNSANWADIDSDGTGDVPVDKNASYAGLSFTDVDDKIVFSASSMPTLNIAQMGGQDGSDSNTPLLDLRSGGTLSIEAGVGRINGITTNAAVARDIYTVGDGIGLPGTSDGVTLNVKLKGYLNRHGGGNTHNFIVNSDGILNFDPTDDYNRNNLSFSTGDDRLAIFNIAGGAVNVAGPVSQIANIAGNYVEFTEPGGTFTANFGWDFADLSAVNASIGDDFIAAPGLSLVATDNSNGTFTVAAVPEPSQSAMLLAFLGAMPLLRRRK
jgi:hypothetical protein